MENFQQYLKTRTKNFSINVIALLVDLPKNDESKVIKQQLLRSATSVGANYRAAIRGKSEKDFAYKIKIIEEEADESLFWLELIEEAMKFDSPLLKHTMKEAAELTAIFTSIGKTLKGKLKIKSSYTP